MVQSTRRQLFRLLISTACAASTRLRAAPLGIDAADPIIGAIRWDAWYDPDGGIGRFVEQSLVPPEFHSRMPFFGQEVANGQVRIDGNNQVTFDREITYARQMGLDYWAYCWYEDGSPLRRAWALHQTSAHAHDVNWCMLWQLSHLGGQQKFLDSIPEYLGWFAQANYQKVNGAPLVYLYVDSDAAIAEQWGNDIVLLASAIDSLRAACRGGRIPNPHIVIMKSDPSAAESMLRRVRAAAISNYMGWVPTEKAAPYSKLTLFNRLFWDKMLATGAAIVPIIMTGWDTRPRQLNPPPWEEKSPDRMSTAFVTPGTNDEIDNAIRFAEAYVKQHRVQCPSNLLLIYSWDECDEGGGALVSKSYLSSEHNLK